MPSGTYIGSEGQFRGRHAQLLIKGSITGKQIVHAQFDEGKHWETHSRLVFPIEEWDIELEPEFDPYRPFDSRNCQCHERDDSFTCDYCKTFGHYGYMEHNPHEQLESD